MYQHLNLSNYSLTRCLQAPSDSKTLRALNSMNNLFLWQRQRQINITPMQWVLVGAKTIFFTTHFNMTPRAISSTGNFRP